MLIRGNEAQMTYKLNQIRTASKDQLLLMIYDIGISATKIAKNAVKDENNEMANKELQRAQAALRELMSALDVNAGEWANTLMSLYEFMHEQLVKANVSKDPDLIESVKLMLEELRAVWQEAIEKNHAESFAQEEMDHGEVKSQGGFDFAG